jgi:hypothetical protein
MSEHSPSNPSSHPEEHPELVSTGSAAEERVRLANQEEGRVPHEAKAAPDGQSRRPALFGVVDSLFKKRR